MLKPHSLSKREQHKQTEHEKGQQSARCDAEKQPEQVSARQHVQNRGHTVRSIMQKLPAFSEAAPESLPSKLLPMTPMSRKTC